MHRLYVTLAAGAAVLLASLATFASPAGAAMASYPVHVDATDRSFDGIGAISGGGATSRLLVSYPEDQRSALLDLIFKPQHGASLHICKVEIGGDCQSTEGTEASHEHYDGDLNLNRGYEWWMMKEAKARNPDVKLYGLPWGFPGWVGNGTSSPYTAPELTAKYVTDWVVGAKTEHDLEIDYVGVWNERAYNIPYIKTLRKFLDDAGHQHTLIVGNDRNWDIAGDMLKDQAFADAVGVIGAHYPGTESTADAVKTGKPLWASEDMSTYNDLRGGGCWARVMNQNYVNGNMTSSISWNMFASYFNGLLWQGTGLIEAFDPWTGNWNDKNVGVLWASAHTTQFVQPGWRYVSVGEGSGRLDGGGSYVTLTNGTDFTIVIEKMAWAHSECIRPSVQQYNTTAEDATFKLSSKWADALAGQTLSAFVTQFGWDGMVQTESTFFEQGADVPVAADGTFTLHIPVDGLITLTTCSSCGNKGSAPPSPPATGFPPKYSDDFESTPLSAEAPFWTDQTGSFEVVNATDASHGHVMRQAVPLLPMAWIGDFAPYSIIGDIRWADQSVSADVLVEDGGGAAFVAARTRTCCKPAGAYFSVWPANGTWALTRSIDVQNTDEIVASGALPPGVKTNTWHTLRLDVTGPTADCYIDGTAVVKAANLGWSGTGWAAIGTSPVSPGDKHWTHAQFDNFALTGSSYQCPPAKAGDQVGIAMCGDPNGAATEWVARADAPGQVKLKSTVGSDGDELCMAADGSSNGGASGKLLVKVCDSSDPEQTFSFVNSTQWAWAQIQAGDGQFVQSQASLDAVNDQDPGAMMQWATGGRSVGFVYNEVGLGRLTFYGPHVTDQCVAVCNY